MRLVRWVCEDYAGLCMHRSMDSMDYAKVELLVERYIVKPMSFSEVQLVKRDQGIIFTDAS